MLAARQVILIHLARAARAWRVRSAASHVLATVSALAFLVALGLVALSVVPVIRPWLILALACTALCGAGLALGAALRPRSPGLTARRIGIHEPALGGALADAVEFSDRLNVGTPASGSADLASAHVIQAARRTESDDPKRHARRAIPRLNGGLAAFALLLAGLMLLALPLARSVLFRGAAALAGDAVSYGEVELTHRHPAYLRLPDRVEVGLGDVRAPVGTHVRIRFEADRPLRSARLEAPGGITEMIIDGSTATGRLVVTRDGAWKALLEDLSGGVDPDPPTHLISALVDASPDIRLRAPEADEIVLAPGESLELRWSAKDDHGIGEVVVVRRASTGEAQDPAAGDASPGSSRESPGSSRESLGTFEPPTPQRSGSRTLSARALGLEADQPIEIWLEARDDDEVSGPKWAASRHLRVRLGSVEESAEQVAFESELLAERILATLAGHLVRSPDRVPRHEDLVAHHEDFSRDVSEIGAGLARVLEGMQRAQEDLVATTALEQMRGRLDWMLRARGRRVAEERETPERLRSTLVELHPGEIEELERDVLFFDMWADRRASLRAADAAAELLDAIQRLQILLARASEGEVPPEARGAVDEIARRADGVAPLLEELAASSPNEQRAQEARDAFAKLEAAIDRLGRAVDQRDAPGTRETTGEVARIASGLADVVEELARSGSMGDPELAQAVDRAHGEIKRLKRQQADLRDRTNAVRDEARDGLSKDDRRRLDEMFEELLRLADEAVAAEAEGERIVGEAPSVVGFFERLEERARIETRLGQIEEAVRAGGAADAVERERLRQAHRVMMRSRVEDSTDVESIMRLAQGARDALGRLRQVLAERQIAAARAPARWSLVALEILVDDLGRRQAAELEKGRPSFQTASVRASEILSRLDELERQVEQAMQSTLTSSQRRDMGQIARSQGELLEQSRQLAAQLREMSADAAFLDDQVAREVEQAGEHMGEASGKLHGSRPGEAAEEQGEAMARLDAAAKAMSPRPGKGRGGQGPGGRERRLGQGTGDDGRQARFGSTSREEVDIPDAEDYRVPREFREEILEAMREASAPEGYEEQVREYYRRLVE